jgi:hypothetical protein
MKAFARKELFEGTENNPLVFDEEHSRYVVMLGGVCHGHHYRNGGTMKFGLVASGVRRFVAMTYAASHFAGLGQDFEFSNTDFEYLRS